LYLTDLEVIIMNNTVVLIPANIKAYLLMTLQDLEYLHINWILHRDLKQNNLLVNCNVVLKIGDLVSPSFMALLIVCILISMLTDGTWHQSCYLEHIRGGSIHTLKENAEALVAATSETGLEGNADKTKYVVMSRDRNAGRIHSED